MPQFCEEQLQWLIPCPRCPHRWGASHLLPPGCTTSLATAPTLTSAIQAVVARDPSNQVAPTFFLFVGYGSTVVRKILLNVWILKMWRPKSLKYLKLYNQHLKLFTLQYFVILGVGGGWLVHVSVCCRCAGQAERAQWAVESGGCWLAKASALPDCRGGSWFVCRGPGHEPPHALLQPTTRRGPGHWPRDFLPASPVPSWYSGTPSSILSLEVDSTFHLAIPNAWRVQIP